MPLVIRSRYPAPPRYQFNGHFQTILPALRSGPTVSYERERIDTPDGDFLDLDWLDRGSRRLAILSHGLERNSERRLFRLRPVRPIPTFGSSGPATAGTSVSSSASERIAGWIGALGIFYTRIYPYSVPEPSPSHTHK